MPTFSGGDFDIIDEAIYYFKANVFFKNYEIKVSEIEIYGLGHGSAANLLPGSKTAVPLWTDPYLWANVKVM